MLIIQRTHFWNKLIIAKTATMSNYLVFFVAVMLLGQIGAITQVTEETKESCRQETGLSVRESKLLKADEVLTHKKKCYLKCLFEKGGYIADNGDVLVEKMKSDVIADGGENGLKAVYGCVETVDKVESCDDITRLIACFKLPPK